MGTERFVELDKARLVERADQTAGVRDQFFDRGAVAGIGSQVTGPQFVRRKQRQATADIQHDIAGRDRAIARDSELQPAARRRRGKCIVVDREFKLAEMPTPITHATLQDWKLV
jgi:hypothetical protein